MSHVRHQIRDHVATLLSATTELSGRVFASRVHPVDNFPGALVYTLEETSEIVAAPFVLQRELSLEIVAYVKVSDTVDDDLDDLAAVIEAALAADPKLGGLAKTSFVNASAIELTGDGEKDVGTLTLTFVVVYMTAAATPQTAL